MKYPLPLVLLLAACAPRPCPTVFRPRPMEAVAPEAPAASEALSSPLQEATLKSRIRRECEARYRRSVAMDAFCSCLAGAVAENVRAAGIITYQDFHERVEEALPTAKQIRACIPLDWSARAVEFDVEAELL